LPRLEFAHVNLVVAVLIWVMIYPMMIQIDFAAVKDVGRRPQGLILTLVINWLIKPFTMAALGVLFFRYVFASWVDPQSASEYIAGMILLGVAPCTAMVFVWSQLTKGDPAYTLVQVSVNDLVMVFAFAPIAALLLGVTDLAVPWETLLRLRLTPSAKSREQHPPTRGDTMIALATLNTTLERALAVARQPDKGRDARLTAHKRTRFAALTPDDFADVNHPPPGRWQLRRCSKRRCRASAPPSRGTCSPAP
jgi:hypothetical protein